MLFFYYGEDSFRAKQKIDALKHKFRQTIDKSGHKHFQVELRKYLKEKANINKAIIRKIKTQRSKGNNLLQLVDYIAGVVNRNILKKKRADNIRNLLSIKRFMFKFGLVRRN